ncbi:hypothetical protein B0H19DRAFT_1276156 [Mycena capillaripes]|nr:hypothetical protein B0H19DRAFT_1276156 [Mycena capillaripes]
MSSLPTNGTRDGRTGAEIHRCANGWLKHQRTPHPPRSAGKEASLAWALNDVFGDVFWIGGAFKISAQVIRATSQLMGPILVKAIINFSKARAAAWETGGDLPFIGKGGYGVWTHRCCPAAECLSAPGVFILLFHGSMVAGVAAHATYIYCCVLSMLYGLPRCKVHKPSLLGCNLKTLSDDHSHHLPPHPANPGIYDIRANEVRGICNIQHAQSANIAVAFSLPILAPPLAFVTYTRATSGFDTAVIFSSSHPTASSSSYASRCLTSIRS